MRTSLVSAPPYWGGYWQSHERFATRLTVDRSAARIGRAAAARDAKLPETKAGAKERVGVEERTRSGVTERATREKDIATRSAREGRDRAGVQTRMTRETLRRRVRTPERPCASSPSIGPWIVTGPVPARRRRRSWLAAMTSRVRLRRGSSVPRPT